MSEDKYKVIFTDTGEVIGEHLRLDYALVLVKAICLEYYNESKLTVGITREDNAPCC